jgi:ssDNA-binding Zn-finger/Zn-ribbon topoisomerase 1
MKCPQCSGEKQVELTLPDDNKVMVNCEMCGGLGHVANPENMLECEICSELVNKDSIKTAAGDMKVCAACYDKEQVAQAEMKASEEQRIVESDPRFKFHLEVDRDLGAIPGNEFERAIQIKSRIDDLGQKLFEVQTKRNRYYQNFIELTKTLRAEERLRLGLSSDYKPYTPKAVEPKGGSKAVRQSKEEKSYSFMVQTFFGKKLLKLDEVNKECFKEHPDWWSNGLVKPEFKTQHEEYVDSRGAVTSDMALVRVKDMVSGAKAKTLTQYASGERKLSE